MMKTTLAPMHRVKFPAVDGEYLTPVGWRIARIIFRLRRSIPLVSMRRYLVARLERDRLIHDLHMMAIKQNALERELRTMRAALNAMEEGK